MPRLEKNFNCKTKVCSDCGKRKRLDHFYTQKPTSHYILSEGSVKRRRGDCKACHNVKTRKANLKWKSREERLKYMADYCKIYNMDSKDFKKVVGDLTNKSVTKKQVAKTYNVSVNIINGLLEGKMFKNI